MEPLSLQFLNVFLGAPRLTIFGGAIVSGFILVDIPKLYHLFKVQQHFKEKQTVTYWSSRTPRTLIACVVGNAGFFASLFDEDVAGIVCRIIFSCFDLICKKEEVKRIKKKLHEKKTLLQIVAL